MSSRSGKAWLPDFWRYASYAVRRQGGQEQKTRVVWNVQDLDVGTLFGPALIEGQTGVDDRGAEEVAKYNFKTQGQLRSIQVKHGIQAQAFFIYFDDKVWKVQANGEKQVLWQKLPVPLADGTVIAAVLQLQWNTTEKNKWKYALTVNAVVVPAHWVKQQGDTPGAYVPEVVDHEAVAEEPEANSGCCKCLPCCSSSAERQECVFRFKTRGQERGLAISHKKGEFSLHLDETRIHRLRHGGTTFGVHSEHEFDVPVSGPGGEVTAAAKAKVTMDKGCCDGQWRYTLSFGATSVPVTWARGRAAAREPELPEVVGEASPEELSPPPPPAGDEATTEANAVAAYADGERVEYYSRTHRRWLPGTVYVTWHGWADGKPQVLYCVSLLRGQLQDDVQLYSLRRPFKAQDTVELLSDTSEWVRATIGPDQPRAATLVGYTVQTARSSSYGFAGDNELANVQPTRLRRCFPQNTQVHVYEDSVVGWVPAKIAPDAGEGVNLPEVLEQDLNASIRQDQEAGGSTLGSEPEREEVETARRPPQPWTKVPVVWEDGTRDERPLYRVGTDADVAASKLTPLAAPVVEERPPPRPEPPAEPKPEPKPEPKLSPPPRPVQTLPAPLPPPPPPSARFYTGIRIDFKYPSDGHIETKYFEYRPLGLELARKHDRTYIEKYQFNSYCEHMGVPINAQIVRIKDTIVPESWDHHKVAAEVSLALKDMPLWPLRVVFETPDGQRVEKLFTRYPIGINLTRHAPIQVHIVMQGSPAEGKGVQQGWKIAEIHNVDVRNGQRDNFEAHMSFNDVSRYLHDGLAPLDPDHRRRKGNEHQC